MLNKLNTILLGALGFLAIIAAAFFKGRRTQAKEDVAKQNEIYIETRKRIDETSNPKRDARAARKWLRDRVE